MYVTAFRRDTHNRVVSAQSAVQGTGGGSGNLLVETTTRGVYFDAAASKNVTALLGKTAYLNCRVKNLANRTVSEFCCGIKQEKLSLHSSKIVIPKNTTTVRFKLMGHFHT